MMGNSTIIRLFLRGIHAWLFLYVLSALPAWRTLWAEPLSPALAGPPGPFSYLTHAFGTWLPGSFALPCALVLLALALYGVFRPLKWWMSLLVWVIYMSLMDQAWLSASGGQQLMANVLLWSIFLRPTENVPTWRDVLGLSAFWIIRMQLVVAYGVTAIQKLTGEFWPHGLSVGIVATDPDYGPAFLAGRTVLTSMITYGVLAFQLSFPLAVWWRPTRRVWMWMGVAFHLSTITYGIPDMAFAFLAVYPIWFSEECAERWSVSPLLWRTVADH